MNMLQALGTQGQTGQIRNMMQMIKSAGNPQAMMQQMMRNNPQYQQAMKLVDQAGGDPKKAFYQMAQQMGVNPDDILGMMN